MLQRNKCIPKIEKNVNLKLFYKLEKLNPYRFQRCFSLNLSCNLFEWKCLWNDPFGYFFLVSSENILHPTCWLHAWVMFNPFFFSELQTYKFWMNLISFVKHYWLFPHSEFLLYKSKVYRPSEVFSWCQGSTLFTRNIHFGERCFTELWSIKKYIS